MQKQLLLLYFAFQFTDIILIEILGKNNETNAVGNRANKVFKEKKQTNINFMIAKDKVFKQTLFCIFTKDTHHPTIEDIEHKILWFKARRLAIELSVSASANKVGKSCIFVILVGYMKSYFSLQRLVLFYAMLRNGDAGNAFCLMQIFLRNLSFY